VYLAGLYYLYLRQARLMAMLDPLIEKYIIARMTLPL
jgi:hypothetical protein